MNKNFYMEKRELGKVIGLIALIILTSCHNSPVQSLTPRVRTPTPDITLKTTSTAGSFNTSSEKTASPNSTITMEGTNTIPTPIGNDTKNKIKYLVDTNNNCEWPCWWGIYPLKTNWSDASQYLSSLASNISRGGVSPDYSGLIYRAEFIDPANANLMIAAVFFVEVNNGKKGTVEVITTNTEKRLPLLLKNLGIPDQIWIHIGTLDIPEYSLVLFYFDGEMIVYKGQYSIDSDHSILICPKDFQDQAPDVWLWNPSSGKTFQDIGKLGVIPPLTQNDFFKPISSISDVQTEGFYNIFINQQNSQCLKIRINN
jgi:hypothetical protein